MISERTACFPRSPHQRLTKERPPLVRYPSGQQPRGEACSAQLPFASHNLVMAPFKAYAYRSSQLTYRKLWQSFLCAQ